MVDVLKHTQYCMGRGYLNKDTFNEAVAQDRSNNRVQRDLVENMMAAARDAQTTGARESFTARQLPQPQNLMQRAVLVLAQPLLALANFFQNIPRLPLPLPGLVQNAFQNAGTQLNQAVANLLSFFFGNKKDNDKVEERKQREDTEIAESDLFTRFVVEESHESSMGSGQ